MNPDTQLTTQHESPFSISTIESAEKMAGWIAESGCFGIKKPAQALTLMMIAHSEGQTLAQSLKRYHVFDDGKLSQRADYTQSEFEKRGTILWHIRTTDVVAATFFKSRPIDDEARSRATKRFQLQWKLDSMIAQPERDDLEISKLMLEISALAREDEATIIKTLFEAEQQGITEGAKGLKNNWRNSKAMLQWRCVTDGVKIVDASVMAGLSSDADLMDAKAIELSSARIAYDPKSRDLESMQAIVDDYIDRANQPEVTPGERQRLLGLASEMRAKMADLDATPETIIEKNRDTAQRMVDATDATIEPPEEDQIPGLEAPTWKDYRLQCVAAGRSMNEITLQEAEILLKAALKRKPVPGLKEDIAAIRSAITNLSSK